MALNRAITDWHGQRIWLVGASSGIGAALARALHGRGARVALSARRADALKALVAQLDVERACALPLDVTNVDSIVAAERELIDRWQGYDQVVMLAGDYVPQQVQDFDLATTRRILDTNLGGVYNTLAVVLPRLRAAQSGGLVIVSSVAAYRGLPRSLAYGPSKAALNNLAEALYLELHGEGVAVTLVCPGFVRTPLTAHNPFPMPALIEPAQAAHAIIAGLERGAFEIHFPRRFTWVMKALALLPARLYLPLLRWLTR